MPHQLTDSALQQGQVSQVREWVKLRDALVVSAAPCSMGHLFEERSLIAQLAVCPVPQRAEGLRIF